jgi:hypothetical protein
MWEDANYCWVVLCKNHWFHIRQNLFFRHKIPLAETDAVAPLPFIGKPFAVRCDECGKTYTYKPKDVLRFELEVTGSFKPHPLFQEELSQDGSLNDSNRSAERPREESPRNGPPQGQQTRAKGA